MSPEQQHKPKLSPQWITSIVLWSVLALVILILGILWGTGVIFQATCPTTAAPRKTPDDYSEHSFEAAILRVAPYDPLNITRTEEFTASREQTVIDKFVRDVPSDTDALDVKHDDSEPSIIEHVMYIQWDENAPDYTQIDRLNLPASVSRERLSAVKRSDHGLGQLLSHIACLSKALPLQKNVLILEEDFALNIKSSAEIQTLLESTQAAVRWDVIGFIQNITNWQKIKRFSSGIQMCKVLEGQCASAYLVNKLYVPKLLAYYIQRLRAALSRTDSAPINVATVQMELQSTDLWVGYDVPIGVKKGTRQTYLHDLTSVMDENQTIVSLQVQPPIEQKTVAICHIAIGSQNQYVSSIQKDCFLKFLKVHRLEFFLVTDEAQSYGEFTAEGTPLNVMKGTPLNVISSDAASFQSLWDTRQILSEFDFIYVMDVTNRIYMHPFENQIMIQGVVGSTESNHFFGGEAKAVLNVMNDLVNNAELTVPQYFQLYPPTSILPHSYLFAERCLDIACKEPICRVLRGANSVPIMGQITL